MAGIYLKNTSELKSYRANEPVFGYTMIELLVTIGITGLIAAIILVNYPKLSEQLSVSQAVHEIALSFRETKTYALAVRQYSPGIYPGYGLHFDLATPQNFLLYAASIVPATNSCSPYAQCVRGDTTHDVDAFTLRSGIQIVSICNTDATPICFKKLDVAYVRPTPDVYITGFDNGGVASALQNKVEIKIRAPGGRERSVFVSFTGEISVK